MIILEEDSLECLEAGNTWGGGDCYLIEPKVSEH